METKNIIGQRLTKIRNDLRYTQEQFAQKLKVKRAAITDVERGKTFPNPILLENIHKEYKINLNWLITGKGKMKLNGYNIGDEIDIVEEGREEYVNYKDKYIESLEKRLQNLEKTFDLFLRNHEIENKQAG